jgi:hypothetical protein
MQLATESPRTQRYEGRVFVLSLLTCRTYHVIILTVSRGESDVGSAQDGWSEKGTGDTGASFIHGVMPRALAFRAIARIKPVATG